MSTREKRESCKLEPSSFWGVLSRHRALRGGLGHRESRKRETRDGWIQQMNTNHPYK